MIDAVTNADAIPVLERAMQFAGARHRIITGNIANIDTPEYRPVDLSVPGFQTQLAEAIDGRRDRHGAAGGRLDVASTRELSFTDNGLETAPTPVGDNILFHDGNDRDPERLMQSLVENFMTFRAAAEFIRSRFDMINTAIRERI